jgi:hypothetical protein
LRRDWSESREPDSSLTLGGPPASLSRAQAAWRHPATAEIGPEACDVFVQLGYLAGPDRRNPPAVRTTLGSLCNARSLLASRRFSSRTLLHATRERSRKKIGRPPIGKGVQFNSSFRPEVAARIDSWRAAQPNPQPSRSEAIRQLIEKALANFRL